MSSLRTILLSALLLGSAGTLASAETGKAPAPAPVSADPASTAASYGDWVLRCQRMSEKERVCEVAQTIQVKEQDKTLPLAQIAFSQSKPGTALKVTVALPNNIVLPSSAALALTEKDPHPIELPWRRCLPGGCIADAQPAAEAIKPYLTASEPGRLSFTDASGRVIAMPLSLRGLQQALDAMTKG